MNEESVVTETTGDGYQIINLESGVSEPQITPTPYDPASLSFVSLASEGDSEPVSGSVHPSSETEWGSESHHERRRRAKPGGKASQFLESKGFGWLMEVEEEEGEEENKPLL